MSDEVDRQLKRTDKLIAFVDGYLIALVIFMVSVIIVGIAFLVKYY